MADNLQIYNTLRVVPDDAKRTIEAGRLKGLTDINPMWRIKALTELFGPFGIGWWTENERYYTVQGAGESIAAFCELDIVYVFDGRQSKPIHGIGGSMFVAVEKNGARTNDDAFKMARTDAIGNAGKNIGLAADVYNANDRTRYAAFKRVCEKCKKEITDQMRRDGTLESKENIIIRSLVRYKKMLCVDCQKEAEEEIRDGGELKFNGRNHGEIV